MSNIPYGMLAMDDDSLSILSDFCIIGDIVLNELEPIQYDIRGY